jgi:1-phosphatidylinositol-3-phosphate 5-kinase
LNPSLGRVKKMYVQTYKEDEIAGLVKGIKPLMFLEGCPPHLGCTILLRGDTKETLRKVKSALQVILFLNDLNFD